MNVSKQGFLDNVSLTFIGAGNMAEAMIRGLLERRSIEPHAISVNNRTGGARLRRMSEVYGVRTMESKRDVVSNADAIILAVKPVDFEECMKELVPHVREDQLLISILAGITSKHICEYLPRNVIARAMPNTSARVGAGVTALSYPRDIDPLDRNIVRIIFESVGAVVTVEECLLDAVTGLSGSGPAYIYYVAEALTDAGEELGLDREIALRLAVETIAGAGAMLKGDKPPVELRREVTSAGGTTEAGIEILDRREFSGILKAAVRGAAYRSREMAKLHRCPGTRRAI